MYKNLVGMEDLEVIKTIKDFGNVSLVIGFYCDCGDEQVTYEMNQIDIIQELETENQISLGYSCTQCDVYLPAIEPFEMSYIEYEPIE